MTEAALSCTAMSGAVLGAGAGHPGANRPVGDQALGRLAARGEQRAFAAIFRRHHQELYRYCRAILRDDEDARDALQNTMVRALDALPGEEREIALRPWLYRVAHNEAISILRTRRPSARLEEADKLSRPGVDEEAESRQRLRQLAADLDALPERARSALAMRELSGLSYGQIAVALETSEAAARQAVYEARVALHELEEGRDMRCDDARSRISTRDRRMLRGRKLRAHLRGCGSCRDFEAGIGRRKADLAALAPPLPAVAAAGLLNGILGAGHGGAGGSGLVGALGGGTKAGVTSVALKSGVTVIAAATLGVGAAQVPRIIHNAASGSQASEGGAAAPVTASPSLSGQVATERPGAPGQSGQLASRDNHQATAARSDRSATHEASARVGGPHGANPAAPTSPNPAGITPASGDGHAYGTSGGGPPSGDLPSASSHGQQTAASHAPPAPAVNHPTPSPHPAGAPAHPSPQGPPAGVPSHPTGGPPPHPGSPPGHP
jgi:RNA polymerase sigma factor (sigma-70 family)